MTTKNYSLGKLLTHPSVVVCSDTMRIWAFGGGKGGIGKSFLCTNLAVILTWVVQMFTHVLVEIRPNIH